ncbi:RNA replicase polyprotein [Frankliniella fusca]|uniref:RNA replicase polyprotein n=1 Tax=Frankliniella fusca TaxID=407009 RepID=A0AAE1HVL0_9NEOP|nr:RNA replicase polyprotein [Frankliniella fusca]
MATSAQARAEAISEHFEKVHTANDHMAEPQHTQQDVEVKNKQWENGTYLVLEEASDRRRTPPTAHRRSAAPMERTGEISGSAPRSTPQPAGSHRTREEECAGRNEHPVPAHKP